MDKKNIGMTLGYIFAFVWMAIIGMCFSTFVDQKQQVEVNAVNITTHDGIEIYSGGQQHIDKLTLQSPSTGLKPASSKTNTKTEVPFSVVAKVGSEGSFGTFEVVSQTSFEIIFVEARGLPEEELKNIKIFIKGNAIALDQTNASLATGDANEKPTKFTILVWMDNHASEKIVGSKIDIFLEVRGI